MVRSDCQQQQRQRHQDKLELRKLLRTTLT